LSTDKEGLLILLGGMIFMCSKQSLSTNDSRSDRQDVFPVINEIIDRLTETELRTALVVMAHEAPELFISCLSDPQAFRDVPTYQTAGLLPTSTRSLRNYGSLGSGVSVHREGS